MSDVNFFSNALFRKYTDCATTCSTEIITEDEPLYLDFGLIE